MAHPDALGYLADLSKELKLPWLDMICDLASTGANDLTADDLTVLFPIFVGQASYVRPPGGPGDSVTAAAAATPAADFLEALSEFSNFKLIGETLQIDFKKRITVVFGANGSGKSSICETLRVLASPDKPNRPLQNVRVAAKNATGFKFKFRTDGGPVAWSPAVGYGIRRATIKHFDATVASRNIRVAVDPGRVITLAPFKLNVFERTTALASRFRQDLLQRQRDNAKQLADCLAGLRATFVAFPGRPLATIDEKSSDVLDIAIKLGEDFADDANLAAKRAAIADMEKATSEEGLKLLKSEERELAILIHALDSLTTAAIDLRRLDPAGKTAAMAAKQEAQAILARALVPAGGTLDTILALARAAAPLCPLDKATGKPCPLCRRDLGDAEAALFKQYGDLLGGELEREITVLKADLATARERADAIAKAEVAAWSRNVTVPEQLLSEFVRLGEAIVAGCHPTNGMSSAAATTLDAASALVAGGRKLLQGKTTAIEAAAKGRQELLGKLAALKKEVEPLAYVEAARSSLPRLTEARLLAKRATLFTTEIGGFQGVLTKITNTAKKAHEALVVADFAARLDREYVRLAEKRMAEFGVKLSRKGTDASVTILPQVGTSDIEGVLSEGEQRVHALALFFAELETCQQSVVVFDDPVSSFDYNYISNYCARLRDFARDHPDRQIVVLTHNWEFFMHLQSALNVGGLNSDMAVQVLENCSVIGEYSEKTDELKTSIDAILALPNEPTKAQKEELGGKMRRLIEAIINTHVFANQRHQYKQRSHAVSEFHHYTKLVPLLPPEASVLRDLYAKLSISEHDDLRNAYVNSDRAAFQTRYDAIKGIEAAIMARK